MKSKAQRQIFLEGEGDSWLQRNEQIWTDNVNQWIKKDPLAPLIVNLPLPKGPEISVLEVGCGQGLRLAIMQKEFDWSVRGVDPSEQAIRAMNSKGIFGNVGTADKLPVEDGTIDLLVFGFCLYLCDRADLFKIASEADRVLKPQSWLSIIDFWSPHQVVNDYHHLAGVKSFKSDLPAIFSWHPSYLVMDHQIRHHESHSYTDDSQEWVSTTVLRKFDPSFVGSQ